jgi:hypothetical protein
MGGWLTDPLRCTTRAIYVAATRCGIVNNLPDIISGKSLQHS